MAAFLIITVRRTTTAAGAALALQTHFVYLLFSFRSLFVSVEATHVPT